MVSRYRPLWCNRCRPVSQGLPPLLYVRGLRPCSTSQCWLGIPMWNLNLQRRRIAIQKWRQQRPRVCSVRHEQRWLPPFMARTTYGMFLPLRFSTMTATVSTSTTKSPMNSNLPNAPVRSGPSSTALSLPAQNNAAALISSLLNLTDHFPKAYLIGPMTGSPNHKASTCGAATCGRCSWALWWAARSAWLSIVVVKKRKTLKYYRVFKTNFAGCVLNNYQNVPRPSEHPPVGGKYVKTFRWDQRLQIQNLFTAFKRVPRWK